MLNRRYAASDAVPDRPTAAPHEISVLRVTPRFDAEAAGQDAGRRSLMTN